MSKKNKKAFDNSIHNAFKYIQSQGFIQYDILIPEHILYGAFNITFEPDNPWNILPSIIKLKQYLEYQGYKTSQRNGVKGLYIEPAFKVNYKIKQRRNRNLQQLSRDNECARNVDRDSLSYRNQKELDHNLHVMSLLNQAMNSILKDII